MSGWRCFVVERSDFVRRSLRRYGVAGSTCPTTFPGSMTYHNAEVVTDPELPAVIHPPVGRMPDAEEMEDARWPKICACGYAFHPEDHWQVNLDALYGGAPDGNRYRLRDLPPGAIWRADWLEQIHDNPYADPFGRAWALMMPCGIEWMIYGHSSGDAGQKGPKWDVRGTVPNITVRPSINLMGRYHGFVENGIVLPDVEGRTYPKFPETA